MQDQEGTVSHWQMKHLLLTTIAAVLLVGCTTTQQPEPPTAKAPDISIHDAAAIGNIEAFKQHLAAGTDVNAKDEKGWAPLHFMAVAGNKEIAELLIDKGADVNAKDDIFGTPLDWAVDSPYSDEETAALLRKHGGKTGAELKAEGAK